MGPEVTFGTAKMDGLIQGKSPSKIRMLTGGTPISGNWYEHAEYPGYMFETAVSL